MQGQKQQIILDSDIEQKVGPSTKKVRVPSPKQGDHEGEEDEWR